MTARLVAIDGGKHHDRDTMPVIESLVDRDGEPADLLGMITRWPLAAECHGCAGRITLAHMLADWQHDDDPPPPRRPTVPPPRPVR